MTFNPALYLPAEMLMELALGMDPPLDVARKHGLSALQFAFLQQQPWFADALLRERQKLADEGTVWAAKALLMTQALFEDLFKESKAGSLKDELRMQLLKELKDAAGMSGRNTPGLAAGPSGPQFQIVINVPEGARGPTNIGDMLRAKPTPPPTVTIDMRPDPVADLGPRPLTVPDFRLTGDLVGPPLPQPPDQSLGATAQPRERPPSRGSGQ